MKNWELLGGLLQRIGEYTVHNWNHRIIVQKLICILQMELKDNLGYRFSWYVRGPYSSRLADDFYRLKDTNNVSAVKYTSDENDARFEKFVKLLGEDKYNANLLELVASMTFIARGQAVVDKADILERIKNLKPYFEDEEYTKALDFLLKLKKLEHLS